MAMCLKDSQCKSWTYVKPGYQYQTAQCWLKNISEPNAKLDECCESGTTSFATLTRTIMLLPNMENLGAIYVSHTLATSINVPLVSVDDWYSFTGFPVDFAYSANIKHQDTDLTPHWEFKSPVVMLQSGNLFSAIIPDIDTLDAQSIQNFPPNLDLRNDGQSFAAFSFATTQSTLTFHSLYSRDGNTMAWGASTPITTNYYLLISSTSVPKLGYAQVTPTLWNLFGHPRLLAGTNIQSGHFNTSLQRFDQWRDDTWHRFAQEVYFQFPCGNETCGSMTSYRNQFAEGFGTNQDGWFNSWFQNLRTAYGMYIAAQRAQDSALAQQAVQVLNLALHAPPQNGTGPFPSIFWLGTDGSLNWVLDSGWAGLCRSLPNPPADCMEYYHTFDMSWTAYWLLRWLEFVNDPRILPMVTGYADFLLQVQQPNGGIPSWFESNSLRPAEQFLLVNAEVAGSGLFLAELYATTGNKNYLNAAIKAAEYLETYIIPTRMWFDFETFFSCSQKPIGFYDGFTNQYPENNLGKLQTTMLYYKLYNVTSNSTYLDTGSSVLDYTLLAQQVWSHPLLSPNLLGGFTTQNTDNEWSDARQGYAAAILLDYYRATWRLEYLERGVAALRSSFAVAPYENWAHTGGSQGDVQGALTGIHWCQGSGMTSIEMNNEWLQDAYVNLKMQHAVGVNGCTLSDLQVASSAVSFNIASNYTWPSGLVVSIEGMTAANNINVNGKSVGTFQPSTFVYVTVPGNVIN
eukprot:Phypoly_transcript_03239.p1 GENE.Phypoly_transcript_03239~~Phypoly_transcript_03239.p1  ORF type:complete len:806 (+),score=96.31 Phypoly_transcript_03239:196-2418(+)